MGEGVEAIGCLAVGGKELARVWRQVGPPLPCHSNSGLIINERPGQAYEMTD